MLGKNEAEYVRAKIAVWWDMKDCPIPQGYDGGRIRPSIESAFKKRGYSGPVFITAYADQNQTADDLLQGLSSTGVDVSHTISESICSVMYSDMLEWRSKNPPPATMMIISNQVENVLSWDLARLQQETKYNLFLAYSFSSDIESVLGTSKEWRWKKILKDYKDEEIESAAAAAALFYCKSCKFDCKSLEKFRKHLSSKKHALEEAVNPWGVELDPVTKLWARNYAAKPEYATAKIAVWWNMKDCPVPEGYDATRVRSSIEREFKNLGYSGPVSITAYGDLTQTPDDLLRGLSSTGVDVAHTISDVKYKRMFSDLLAWRDLNPPPATMMVISDQLEQFLAKPLARLQQMKKYNLFLAYSSRPYKMSVLVTSAEWLWESLLAVSEKRRHVLQKCSDRRSESMGVFYCKLCFSDCKSLDHFRNHLSSKEHALEEDNIISHIESLHYQRRQWIEMEMFPKSKRLRKTSG
ncbi:hypothetical protein V5N11_007570 [Cardamine amara subsp. amara]|uniref:U1-type domain-containing protein n=1 Tax=Cardamine amara subsp. amara TaxID=228776 RepID=A0ABD0ZKW5_CARAN